MSQRKGKTKWLSVGEKERQDADRQSAKAACLQQLHAIYSGLFDTSVLDLIAAQCGYDADEATQLLSVMADDPHLATSRIALQQQQPPTTRQSQAPSSVQPPASPAHPASAWRVQTPTALPAAHNTAHPVYHRPLPIAQSTSTSTLSSWPSPAETHHTPGTKASSTVNLKSKSTVQQQPYRTVLAPPLSANSASASTAAVPTGIRSAPTSPSSALQLTHNQRQASTSSTDSLSPSSAHSTSSLLDVTSTAVRSPPTSAVASSALPQPTRSAGLQRGPVQVTIAAGRRGPHLFPSQHQPASLLPSKHS